MEKEGMKAVCPWKQQGKVNDHATGKKFCRGPVKTAQEELHIAWKIIIDTNLKMTQRTEIRYDSLK